MSIAATSNFQAGISPRHSEGPNLIRSFQAYAIKHGILWRFWIFARVASLIKLIDNYPSEPYLRNLVRLDDQEQRLIFLVDHLHLLFHLVDLHDHLLVFFGEVHLILFSTFLWLLFGFLILDHCILGIWILSLCFIRIMILDKNGLSFFVPCVSVYAVKFVVW